MIYLCKTDGEILGTISGLKKDTVNLTKNLTDLWELTFEVNRYEDENEKKLVQTDYYDAIDEKMWLYQDDEQVYYIIDAEPTTTMDGKQEVKSVTAHSCEVELNKKYLSNFKINMGTTDSLEYLAVTKNEDGTDNYYNINSNGTIKNYIPLVNYEDTQLSLLHLALENTDWSVAENIDEELCNEKYSFESSDNIYTFLMETLSSTAKVIVQFDRKNKEVKIIKGKDFGEDTGIFITLKNLLKSVNVSSSNEEELTTVLYPKGNNDLGIGYVNFGQDYILNLDYFMNEKNEYGDFKFVSEELSQKYNYWKKYRETDIVNLGSYAYTEEYTEEENGEIVTKTRTVNTGTRRTLYSSMSKTYNQLILDISEIHNKLPNDGVQIDYTKWSYEELWLAKTAYANALDALISLYKNDYGVTDIGQGPDYSPTPSDKTNIKDTPYWIDFYCYIEIQKKVEEALKMYVTTDEYGNITDYVELQNGNRIYYSNPEIIKDIDSWEYELSLYGLDELENKRKAWSEKANILYNEVFVSGYDSNNNPIYREPTEEVWNNFTNNQKEQFTSYNNYKIQLNAFLDYMSFEQRDNELVGHFCKGVVRQCEDKIAEYNQVLDEKNELLSSTKEERNELANSVIIDNFKKNGELLFTSDDLSVIKRFIRESNYENNNYLITNIDDIVTTINHQEDLYQDAYEHLYEVSQPQYNFETTLANLYSINDFYDYKDDFALGNFIRVNKELYGENYVKLRLISKQYNPIIPTTEITVTFSTMTKTLDGIDDLAFILKQMSNSSGGSRSSSSSSSTSNELGKNDADVNIANSMLNALLKTERFGTEVNDIILDSIRTNKADFARLFANSGLFNELEVKGNAIIGGQLRSKNYNELAETGSYIDLNNGSFGFGGGTLTWSPDAGLKINNYATQSYVTSATENTVQSIVTEYIVSSSDIEKPLDNDSNWSVIFPTKEQIGNKFLWSRFKKTTLKGDVSYTTPVCLTVAAQDGVGYVGTKEYYLISDKSSGITISGNTWTEDYLSPTIEKPFLWNYEVPLYTNGAGTATEPRVILMGNGRAISKIEEYYYASNTTEISQIPQKGSGSWTSSGTATPEKPYLWNYQRIIYTDGSTQTTEIAMIGSYVKGEDAPKVTQTKTQYNIVHSLNEDDIPSVDDEHWGDSVPVGLWDKTKDNYIYVRTNSKIGGIWFPSEAVYSESETKIYKDVTGLQEGTTEINGGCLKTGNIISNNYAGSLGDTENPLSNTAGSIISLNDGTFSLGGGRLKWDGENLSIQGYDTAEQVNNKLSGYASNSSLSTGTTTINGGCITTGTLQSTNGHSWLNLSNGTFSFGNGSLKWNGTTLETNGKISSTSGSIGGWEISSNSLYYGNDTIGNTNSIVLSTNGLSYKDYFSVNNGGVIIQNPNHIYRYYSNEIYLRNSKSENESFPVTGSYLEPSHFKFLVKPGKVIIWFSDDVANGQYYKFYAAAYRSKISQGERAKGEYPCYYSNPYIAGHYNSQTGVVFDISYHSNSTLAWYVDENNRIDGIELIYFIEWHNLGIKKVDFLDESGNCYRTEYNYNVSLNQANNSIYINTTQGEISGSYFTLSTYNFTSFSKNFSFFMFEDDTSSTAVGSRTNKAAKVSISIEQFKHQGIYNSVVSSGNHVYINSSGILASSVSSSKRYKNSISKELRTNLLQPEKLYDIGIYEFKYNDNYLSRTDQRYGEKFIGFIAEDLYEKYPFLCNLNENGEPESPNYNLMIAPMLSLIQSQHKDIELLKEDIQTLKEKQENGKTN